MKRPAAGLLAVMFALSLSGCDSDSGSDKIGSKSRITIEEIYAPRSSSTSSSEQSSPAVSSQQSSSTSESHTDSASVDVQSNSSDGGQDYSSSGSDEAVSSDAEQSISSSSSVEENEGDYVLNTSTKKFHLPTCRYASSIHDENREDFTGSREELISQGYTPCGVCKP